MSKYVDQIEKNGEIYDIHDNRVESKQDKLISGSNIKTINGESVLGSGNIEIDVEHVGMIDITEGLTEEIRNYVIEHPETMLNNHAEVYTPFGRIDVEIEGETKRIPVGYTSFDSEQNLVYWLDVDWNALDFVETDYLLLKKPIQQISKESVAENDPYELFRYRQPDGKSSPIIEVEEEYHGSGEADFEKSNEDNNHEITGYSGLISNFDSGLEAFLTQNTRAYEQVFTLYYADHINGIRIGSKYQPGSLVITLSKPGTLTFYTYYSYNPQSGEIIGYDENSKVIVDGTEYDFMQEPDPITISLTAGTHTITSGSSGTQSEQNPGRIILTQFEFAGVPYSVYRKKYLATTEQVQSVQSELTTYKNKIDLKLQTDEAKIQKNIEDINEIESYLGTVQIFSRKSSLPVASAEYLNKIIKIEASGAYYQCVPDGEAIHKDWVFNLPGTSEITDSNVESAYGDIGNGFKDYFEMSGLNKVYRNNGSLKLGSSSLTGYIYQQDIREDKTLPVTSLKVGLKAYNNKGSSFELVVLDGLGNAITKYIYLDDYTNETIIDLTEQLEQLKEEYSDNFDELDIVTLASYTDPDTEEVVTTDKRGIVTKLIVDYGEVSYKWQKIIDGSEITLDLREQSGFDEIIDEGSGVIGVIDLSAHPEAAKVYVLLDDEVTNSIDAIRVYAPFFLVGAFVPIDAADQSNSYIQFLSYTSRNSMAIQIVYDSNREIAFVSSEAFDI